MAASGIRHYQGFWKRLGLKEFNLATDTIGCALHTSLYTPDLAVQEVRADLTNEVVAGNGYAAGGIALTSVTWAERGTTGMVLNAANTTFTAAGGSITARYAVLYNATTAGSPLFGYILLDTTPADVVATAGNSIVIDWANTDGVFFFP